MELVHGDDRRVIEPGGQKRLPAQSANQLFAINVGTSYLLNGDVAAQLRVVCPTHHSEPPGLQDLQSHVPIGAHARSL